jgi:branched-chain amino acid transport system ATP-binding protein
MMKVSGLYAGYGHLEVLRQVNLDVPRGDIRIVMGPNGAGKTTLLRSLFGLLEPTAGSITYEGQTTSGIEPRGLIERGISYVPQEPSIFPQLTVDANLRMGVFYQTKPDELVAGVYELFPLLAKHRNSYARTLSGGERRLLEVGRSLMTRPRFLILDEPSLGLSPIMMDRVLDEITRANSGGMTILLVEQRLSAALAVGKSISILRLGQIVASGSIQQAGDSAWLANAMYGETLSH